jgi:hypothetical protein
MKKKFSKHFNVIFANNDSSKNFPFKSFSIRELAGIEKDIIF